MTLNKGYVQQLKRTILNLNDAREINPRLKKIVEKKKFTFTEWGLLLSDQT